MKQLYYIFFYTNTLLVFSNDDSLKHFNHNLNPEELHRVTYGNNDNKIGISNSKVQSNPSSVGLTLNTSGSYFLVNDIAPNPSNSNITIIKINQSNIILDMNDKTIFQIQDNGGSGVVGLEIGSGLKNITIKNGTINNFKGTGLKIGSSCKDITLENIKIMGCTAIGLDLNSGSAKNISLQSISIVDCNGSTGSEAVGLKCKTVTNLQAYSCGFNGNNSGSNSIDGFGVILDGCVGCAFESCTFSTNEGQNGYGVQLKNTSGTTKGCLFKKCVAIANTGTSGIGSGFNTSSASNNKFNECEAIANSGTSAAYGFQNTGNNNSYKNCTSLDQSSSAGASSAYGFYSNNGQSNNWHTCTARGSTGGTGSSVGCGFYLGGTEKFSAVEECKAEANSGGSGKGYGLFLNGANYCSILNNHFEINFGADATNGGYGVKDATNPSTSMFFGNFAFGNGKSDQTIINNFDVSPTPDSSSPQTFPSIQAFFNNYSSLNGQSPFFNIEVIENVAC